MGSRILLIASVFIAAFLFCFSPVYVLAQQADREGFKDPSLFTRPPKCWGDWVDEKEFDAYDFQVSANKTEHVEGHFAKYLYRYDESAGPRPSDLQVIRNYQNAATRIGGKIVYESGDHTQTTLRISKNGQDVWVSVEPYGPQYTLVIVERQAMKQDVVANAGALQSGLEEVGHAEVPGIYFDFGKSDVKPESKPALSEVAKILQENPSMRVWVVGHTDNVGSAQSNVTLSNARAASVIRMLTQEMGIAPNRLAPHGAGPYAPVATNKTEEGRAKNRRVELVEQ